MKKLFLVERRDGTSYFVDENNQMVPDNPFDKSKYTITSMTPVRVQESVEQPRQRTEQQVEAELQQAQAELDAALQARRKDRVAAYLRMGLTEAEAEVASDLEGSVKF